jgi:phosphatidylethanolamine/phosphatidyl-N-methylethanolamine N-methyltransferase
MAQGRRSQRLQREYDRAAGVYDVICGALLQPGRERAIRSIASASGTRILELGIGTGLTIPLYPVGTHVTGVDLSASMLAKARRRAWRATARVMLAQADGGRLPFDDEAFDVVLVPYAISVVPDPPAVAREARRVCRTGGHVVFLNHFLSNSPIGARLEHWLAPVGRLLAFRADLALEPLLTAAGLRAVSIERVNRPPLWTLVDCVKDQ